MTGVSTEPLLFALLLIIVPQPTTRTVSNACGSFVRLSLTFTSVPTHASDHQKTLTADAFFIDALCVAGPVALSSSFHVMMSTRHTARLMVVVCS